MREPPPNLADPTDQVAPALTAPFVTMYDLYIVKRTQIYLEDEQDRKLSRRAGAAGVTKSTLIRQAIDSFLESPSDDTARLARFRAALDEVASSPASLPDGRSYVEALRASDVRRQDEIERRRR